MNPLAMLRAVLCDPEGKCCIQGSDGDRAAVDQALKALEERDNAAEKDLAKLAALEAGGVSNWEWYDESLTEWRETYCKEDA